MKKTKLIFIGLILLISLTAFAYVDYIEPYLTSTGIGIRNVDDWGKIDGFSMEPILEDGDYVLVKKYQGEELFIGQMIRFKNNYNEPKYIIHEIIGFRGDEIVITHGISNPEGENEYVWKPQITHVVVGTLFREYLK